VFCENLNPARVAMTQVPASENLGTVYCAITVHYYRTETWENFVFCIQRFNNYNDNGIDVTYSFGKVHKQTTRVFCLAIRIINYIYAPWSTVLLEKITGS
jgi:hypothetical protein